MNDSIKQLTDLISSEIKKQYRSDRQFAQAMGIPPTTLSSILKNGVRGTAYDTVMRICAVLGIKLIYDDGPRYLDKRAYEVLNEYETLDDLGKQVTKGVIKREKERMESEKERQTLVAFGADTKETRTPQQIIEDTAKTIQYKHED